MNLRDITADHAEGTLVGYSAPCTSDSRRNTVQTRLFSDAVAKKPKKTMRPARVIPRVMTVKSPTNILTYVGDHNDKVASLQSALGGQPERPRAFPGKGTKGRAWRG